MIDMVVAFILAWISTISGVALGGWLVFRTKREGYDSLFAKPEAGESFNVSDDISDMPINISTANIPEPTLSANDAFVEQFADSLSKKVS